MIAYLANSLSASNVPQGAAPVMTHLTPFKVSSLIALLLPIYKTERKPYIR